MVTTEVDLGSQISEFTPRESTPKVEEAALGGLRIRYEEPSTILTNDDIEKMGLKTASGRDFTADQILRSTGVEERRIASPDATVHEMGRGVAQPFIDEVGESVNKVLFLTSYPSFEGRETGLGHAQSLATQTDLRNVDITQNALDLHFACSNGAHFITFLREGEQALVVASELYTPHLADTTKGEYDPSLALSIFGDAAAVFSGQVGRDFRRIHGRSYTYPHNQNQAIRMPIDYDAVAFNASNGVGVPRPHSVTDTTPGHFEMDGADVVGVMKEVGQQINRVIQESGIPGSEIAAIIPHQASLKVLGEIKRKIDPEFQSRFHIDVRTGNTSSVSTFKSLTKLINAGEVRQGDHIVLAGFGAGLFSSIQVVQLGKKA